MKSTTTISPAPSASASASASPAKVVPTTMTINYSVGQGGVGDSMKLSVINSTTVASLCTVSGVSHSILSDSVANSSVGTTVSLYYIQYDGHGINFAIDTSGSSTSSRYYLQGLSNWSISVSDSNSSHPYYNTNTATVSGSVLTLTNGTDKLSITLPNAFA